MSTKASIKQKAHPDTPSSQNWSATIAKVRADKVSVDDLIKIADELKPDGEKDKIKELYSVWIDVSSSPLKFVACFNYGVMLANWGDEDAAIEYYRKAVVLNIGFSQPRINLGLALERKGLIKEAIAEWRKIVDDPAVASVAPPDMKTTALNHVGRVFEIQREYSAAESALSESLGINPNQTDALHHWFHLRQKQCAWPTTKTLPGVSKNKIITSMSPLAALAHEDDPAFQMYVADRIVKEKFTFNVPQLTDGKIYNHQRLRIGYLSGDLCTHAVGLLLPEIFELHDRTKFDIYAYDYSREDGTPLRQRYKTNADHFVSIQALNDLQAAQRIREDEIDILVDLHGLSQGIRAGILAQRPAPIQMTYLGYIGTTMMPYIDYVITDRYCLLEEQREYYSEAPLYLDRCCIPTDRKRVVEPTPTRESVGLPQDKFIYATFNNSYKLNQRMFSSWMNILKAVPNSILWIIDDNPWATENLHKEAIAAGIEASRIIFTPRVTPSQYLARMELADIFLDNHPYNAGSTASDIMWMGTPMVTLSGKTFVSRMAGSLLHHCGLNFLIANSHEQYEALAIALAGRPDLLQAIKLQLRSQRNAGGAFDMNEFTKNLESKYQDAVKQAGLHIST